MNNLSIIALILGAGLVPLYAWMVVWPERALSWGRRFPRDKTAARVITAIDVLWGGWWLYRTPLGPVEALKPLLFLLVPAAYVLLILFMDELLAPRALGGLLLLIPTPILLAARMHPSPFRYALVVVAYVMVIKGIALVLSPYLFRKSAERFMRTTRACRTLGIAGVGFSLFMVALGLFAF